MGFFTFSRRSPKANADKTILGLLKNRKLMAHLAATWRHSLFRPNHPGVY
jgi:hypothetical protein